MRKSILEQAGRWAITAALAIPATAMVCLIASDMPYISQGQAIAVRCAAFGVLVALIAIGTYCAKNGLLPATDEEDGE